MLMRTASEDGSGTATVIVTVMALGKKSSNMPIFVSFRTKSISDPSSRVPVSLWFRAVMTSSTPNVPIDKPSRKNSDL